MTDLHTDLTALHAALPKLSARDADFARSLLLQARNADGGFSGYKPLSDKQAFWVRTLADRAVGTPKPATNVGDFAAVVALFKTAGGHLKRPKIRMRLDDGRPVVLSVAGPSARFPGSINVTDGGSFGASTWYGRVTPDGAWMPSGKVDGATIAALTAFLTAFAKDPAKIAGHLGRLSGSCVFCSRDLTDTRSTEVGYGPICAGHFGLPWGDA